MKGCLFFFIGVALLARSAIVSQSHTNLGLLGPGALPCFFFFLLGLFELALGAACPVAVKPCLGAGAGGHE